MISNEETKVTNIINILKLNPEDYSEVLTLSDVIQRLMKTNIIFKNSIEGLKFIDDTIFTFLKKTIVCFHREKDYDFEEFMKEIPFVSKINIENCDITTLLANANDELPKSADDNYVQMIGYKKKEKAKESHVTNGVNGRTVNGDHGEGVINPSKLFLKNFSYQVINSRNFEILRLMIGDDVMSFFLNHTTIFIFEEKMQNYIQATGPNLKEKLINLLGLTALKKYKHAVAFISQNNNKDDFSFKNNVIPNPEFSVERTKIYYCPNFNRKMGFHRNSLRDTKMKGEDSLSYLFRRMFESRVKSGPKPVNGAHLLPKPNHTEKCIETDIKKYLTKILENIKNYDYVGNLYRCCPNKIPDWKNKKQQILAQIENSDIKGLNENLLLLISEKNTVSYNEVYLFVSTFLAEVVPKEFVGWDNFDIILEKLRIFIKMNRYEYINKVSLFDLKEFSFNNMKVFKHMRMKDKHFKKVGIKLKNYIMKCIIFFIFDTLVVQLIRSHFFVTEKQGDHYKTFYYHKKDWDLVTKINQKKLETQFKPIDIKDAKTELFNNDLIFGKLRLMPKTSSCRPIVSYRRKTPKTKEYLKQSFFETQKVFKYLSSKMQANSDNCVVFDYKTIIKKLLYYKELLTDDLNELSYHTLDIEACYDNIDIDKLVGFLDNEDIISENYISNVLFLVLPKASSKENKYFKDSFEVKKFYFVSEMSEHLHFLDYLKNKNDINYTNCIMYHDFEKQSSKYINKVDLIPRIKAILNCNIIRFNKKSFKQKKGIPQGLSISSFLCNLYFYNLEKQLSKKICRIMTEKNLLMRFMDDYLLITTNNQRVSDFINESFAIANNNSFNFNINKSQYNVDYRTGERRTDEGTSKFEWNGITFQLDEANHFNTYGDAKDDYDLKMFGTVININLPLKASKDDYTWLIKKITSILLTGHPWIYYLNNINSFSTLEKNFKDFCRVVFFKMINLTRILMKYKLLPGQRKFNDIIMKCLKKFFFYINNKLIKAENRKFYMEDLQLFIETFYKNFNELFENGGVVLKRKSIFLYKCIKRKIRSILI
jgi:hypothetical protein